MEDKIIWNDKMTMNFLAHEYQAARIAYPRWPAEGDKRHWVLVHLKGSVYDDVKHSTGLMYACYDSEKEAKECLAKLTEKLVLAGVIEKSKLEDANRFDHVEL